jgi:hypothetical protein
MSATATKKTRSAAEKRQRTRIVQELLDVEVPSTSHSSENVVIGQDNCDGDSALATVTEIGVQVAALCRNTYTQAVA